jgi:hypothetical protein
VFDYEGVRITGLLVCDEPSIIKLMRFDEEDNRLVEVQSFFISKKFGFNDDLDDLNNVAYMNGFLYTPKMIYLAQPDYLNEKSEVVIERSLISTPTLISNSFIIRRKVNVKFGVRTTLKSIEDNNKEVVLLLRPPVDSHKIAQVENNSFELEYFLKDEEERIIRIVPDYTHFKIRIKTFNFTNFDPFNVNDKWDLLHHNLFSKNQVLEETRYIEGDDFRPFQVIASKSGNMLCAIIQLKDKCYYQRVELKYNEADSDENK